MMHHPFEAIPAGKGARVFLPLLAVTLIVLVVMNVTGTPLITEPAPAGIVSYELAGDVAGARAILDSWDDQARVRAGFSLGFDYLFMVAYSTTIAFACVWAAGVFRARVPLLASAGALLAWGQWLAATLDAVENVALTIMLFGAPAAPWPQIAWWSAVPKFVLILVGLVYAAGGAGVWVIGAGRIGK